VDTLGRVDQRLIAFTEGVDTFVVNAPTHPTPTPYSRFGDLWITACGIAAIVLARGRLHPKTGGSPSKV
jgi:apolipoprotein N-acyltransferase